MPVPPRMPGPPGPPGDFLTLDDTDRPAHEAPVTAAEIRRWCWHREAHEREPAPVIGERVLFRYYDWQPPVPATVTGVQDMTGVPNDGWGGTDPDPHVWDVLPGTTVLAGGLRPDPWPWVEMATGDGTAVKCKEARVRGGAGWLRPGSRWDTSE